MAYEIIIGRNPEDKEKYGDKGTILLGKQYVKMGQTTSLSNEVYMDVIRSHVVFVCGKRGSGKSYSMGVMAEGMATIGEEISENLSVIMLDTMGIYWTMKFRNKQDEKLLDEWKIETKKPNVKIYTPVGYFKKFKEQGIPTDFSFSIKPSELTAHDWCLTFNIPMTDDVGVLIERTTTKLRDLGGDYGINTIIKTIESDKEFEQNVKNAAINRFEATKSWGLFSEKATEIGDLVKAGVVTVVDLSCYAITPGAEGIRALVIGLIAQRLFIERMIARKKEEFEAVKESTSYLAGEEKKIEMPLVWLVIDEAHDFIPNKGKTAATNALITILREGRQPGISLILASQQPGKIHTDVMTQADIVLAHRVTAKVDIDALGALMQSYMREGLDKQLDNLPRVKGAGIIFDDVNERLYPMRVRPRFTWHGGEAPSAFKEKKKRFEL